MCETQRPTGEWRAPVRSSVDTGESVLDTNREWGRVAGLRRMSVNVEGNRARDRPRKTWEKVIGD